MKKIKLFISTFLLFLLILPLNVDAASFSMSASARQVSPNGKFTVRVGGDCIGRVNLSVSNGRLSTSSVWVEQGYVTVNVTAGSSGTVTVTATPTTGFSDADANEYKPGSRSVTVNISSGTTSKPSVSKPSKPSSSSSSSHTSNTNNSKPSDKQEENKSNDNKLSSLKVSEGKLSPSFNANKHEYSLKLPAHITSLTVSAQASHSKAHIEGTGKKKLRPGNNNIEITVTAENGSKKTYTIKVYVDDTPQIYLKYKDEKIGIVRNYDGIVIPENFKEKTHKMDKQTFPIFTNGKLNIIYGQNDKKNKSFYLFDKEKNKIIASFTPLKINGKILYIIDMETKHGNLKQGNIKINDIQITWDKLNEKNNSCLLNTINEKGKMVEYLYETTEDTIQLYPAFLEKNNQQLNTKNNIIYILCGIIVVLTSLIAFLIFKLKKGDEHETIK